MLTFRQSVILLVSIITILAIIAIITGLSPIYWPHPKSLSDDKNATTSLTDKKINSSTLKTALTSHLKLVSKSLIELTAAKVNTSLPTTTNIVLANSTITQ